MCLSGLTHSSSRKDSSNHSFFIAGSIHVDVERTAQARESRDIVADSASCQRTRSVFCDRPRLVCAPFSLANALYGYIERSREEDKTLLAGEQMHPARADSRTPQPHILERFLCWSPRCCVVVTVCAHVVRGWVTDGLLSAGSTGVPSVSCQDPPT